LRRPPAPREETKRFVVEAVLNTEMWVVVACVVVALSAERSEKVEEADTTTPTLVEVGASVVELINSQLFPKVCDGVA
jgi:hypothetical protein